MSADSATLAGRRMIEREMKSTCTIRRTTDADPAIDPATGLENPPTVAVIYAGKCRLKFPDTRATQILAAGAQLESQNPILSLPVTAGGSGDVLTDDVATMDTNPLDESLIGTQLRVTGLHAVTQGTARRLQMEAITNG